MDVISKLEKIEQIYDTEPLSEKELTLLEVLSTDTDAEVRLNACKALQMFPYAQTESLFLKMLQDTDDLVQCEACEGLAFGDSEYAWNALFQTARDSSGMLRGYAIASLADVQRNMGVGADITVAFLQELLNKEEDDWVRIIIYRSLIVLGMESYALNFLEHRRDSDYHNRCALLNLLEEMLDDDLWKRTELLPDVLREMLTNENSRAVIEKIQMLLIRLENNTAS